MKIGGAHCLHRLIGILTAAAAALSCMQPAALQASAEGGTCGDNASWTLENGVLTISGTGDVTTAAWLGYSNKVTSAVVGEGITSLPNHAFDGFAYLTDVTMSDTVTTLGMFLCQNCQALKTVKFSDAITEIPLSAFATCRDLENVKLPAALQTVADNAFYGDIGLTSLTLPAHVTSVGKNSFYGNNITELILNDSLETIGAGAFGMSCFAEVTIPPSVKTIGDGAIAGYYESVEYRNKKICGVYTGTTGVTVIRGVTGSAAEAFARSAGLAFVDINGEAHVHTWSEWKVETPAGCEVTGIRIRTCSGCNETEREIIPATGHNWGDWTTEKEPDCDNSGVEVRTCQNCGKTERNVIPPVSHEWGEWQMQTEPGCETDGVRVHTCVLCGKSEEETIPALGHDWGEWVTDSGADCESEGTKTRTCNRCGETETETVPAGSHSWGDWTTAVEPGCETEGKSVRTCSLCGKTEEEAIPALGHDWGEWSVSREATFDEPGEKTRTCNRCGATETEEIPLKTGYHISINCGEGGSAYSQGGDVYGYGESCKIEIHPDEGCEIDTLTADGAAVSLDDYRIKDENGVKVFTFDGIYEDHSFAVTFRKTEVIPNTYFIDVKWGEGGRCEYESSEVQEGSSIRIQVISDPGYQIVTALADGVPVWLDYENGYTFSDIHENHSLEIGFRLAETQQNDRSCVSVSVRPQRAAWRNDDPAFLSASFLIQAQISENGGTAWLDITADCVPNMTPAEVYGGGKLTFSYQGSDSAVINYTDQIPITAEVLVFVRGDGNKNGEIDIEDAMTALNAYVAAFTGSANGAADAVQNIVMDVDDSGETDLNDAMFILQYYTQAITGRVPDWHQITQI